MQGDGGVDEDIRWVMGQIGTGEWEKRSDGSGGSDRKTRERDGVREEVRWVRWVRSEDRFMGSRQINCTRTL